MANFQSLPEAVSDNLHDGDIVAFDGFTHLIPQAAAYEAIRQGRKDLTLIRMRDAIENGWPRSIETVEHSHAPMANAYEAGAGNFGHRDGGDHRQRLGITTKGLTLLITDLALWRPDPETKEFTVVSMHPGVTREQVQETCGWKVKFSDQLEETPPPTELELGTLYELQARPERAHSGNKGS